MMAGAKCGCGLPCGVMLGRVFRMVVMVKSVLNDARSLPQKARKSTFFHPWSTFWSEIWGSGPRWSNSGPTSKEPSNLVFMRVCGEVVQRSEFLTTPSPHLGHFCQMLHWTSKKVGPLDRFAFGLGSMRVGGLKKSWTKVGPVSDRWTTRVPKWLFDKTTHRVHSVWHRAVPPIAPQEPL